MERNRRHQQGQSIVLLAIMLAVIIAVVGLSVDVGHAYAEQRRVQSISNAGALAGMHAVVSKPSTTNNDVWLAVQRAMTGNKVATAGPNYTYRVDYLIADGSVRMLGEWNGSQANVLNSSSKPPAQIERVQVTLGERMDTYFARVAGRNTLTVNANGVACIGDYGYGVYPIGIPIQLRAPSDGRRGHEVYLPGSTTPLPTNDPRWGNWWGSSGQNMEGLRVRLPVQNRSTDTEDETYLPGIHVAWLDWSGHRQIGPDGIEYRPSNTGNLADGWTIPGTMQNGFLEGQAFDEANNAINGTTISSRANILPMRKFKIGDWIAGNSGAHASIENQLEILKAKQTVMLLPFYDLVGSEGSSKLSVHTINMGSFVVSNYQLSGSPKWIEFTFRGAGTSSAQECSSEGVAGWESPDGPAYEKTFSVEGLAKINQVSRKIIRSGTTFDIVLVVDNSDAMRYDWLNRANGSGRRARLEDAKAVVGNFVRQFDISSNGDPDARIALVTYRGSMDNSDWRIQTVAGFQRACAPDLIAQNNNCGGEANKWASIQSGANSMTGSGRVPGPNALETVEQLLQNRRVPPEGKEYRQVVIMLSGGVFNVCGSVQGQNTCNNKYLVPTGGGGNANNNYYNNATYNMISGRPIWQAQRVAAQIRSAGAQIFVVALTPTCSGGNNADCFDTNGMRDISSVGTEYYRQVAYAEDFANTFVQIRQRIEGWAREQAYAPVCVPQDVWTATQGVKVTLTQPENPSWSKQTVTDSNGKYTFGNLPSGQYVLKTEPFTLTSSDGRTYTYSRVRNGYNLGEEGQASVFISPEYADGTPVHSELWLSLPYGQDGTPLNACTAP